MSVLRFLLSLIALTTLDAAAAQFVPGHILPAAVTKQSIGTLDPTRRLDLAIELPLRHEDQLDALLNAIYNSPNARHRQYLTVEEFTQRFGPSQADFDQIVSFAQRNGLNITEVPTNRLLLGVNASVAQIEKVFHTHLRQYQHPTEARLFFAPDAEPSMDVAAPVLHISGLDNYYLPRPGGRVGDADPKVLPPNIGAPQAGSGPSGSYFGSDFRSIYAPGVTLTGAGQSLALVEYDGYFSNDIVTYANLASLPIVPLTNVLVGGFKGGPGTGENDAFEVTLDIEMAASMAPGLSQILVYETSSYNLASTLLNRIATDNRAKQISSSWWFSANASIAQSLKEFAAQGQSFFIIAADNDAFNAANGAPVDPPLDYNFTTVVGGTELTSDSGAWVSEDVWNFDNGTGTGGGISSSFAEPSWQQPVSMSENGGSTAFRNIPDVAAVAAGFYVVYDNGATATGGWGTSFATPLWAGFCALANEQAAANGLPPLGFLNPALYAIGLSDFYTNAFHDVTVGDNKDSVSPDAFLAEPGYDLCTGWGSPNGTNLINLLAPPPIALSIPTVASRQIEFTIANLQIGSAYSVQSSSDLISWTSLATNTASKPTRIFTASAPTNGAAFYRVLEH